MLEYIGRMFSYPFMQRAFLVGILVSLCASLLGVSLVLKRYSMIGDGLSHVGFGLWRWLRRCIWLRWRSRSGGGTCGFYPAASE